MQSGTVVVVEDDPAINLIAVSMFEDADVPVVSFSNADEALSYMYENASGVSAIFTDLQMPGHTDGLFLAEIAGRHWPRVLVLLTSGCLEPAGELPANVRFLPKPWSPTMVLNELKGADGNVRAASG